MSGITLNQYTHVELIRSAVGVHPLGARGNGRGKGGKQEPFP
jgi:hypothetical protein